MNKLRVLTLAALFSGAIHILSASSGPEAVFYVTKPLTILLILAIALGGRKTGISGYRLWIGLGLCLSLLGDIFLMLPQDLFLPGLVAFLLAHIAYIAAFRSGRRFKVKLLSLLPFLLFSTAVFLYLSPVLKEMKLPVLVYVAVITTMGWQALDRYLESKTGPALYALLGAILFSLSDTILALDRFHGSLKLATLLIMSTYYLAQWLLALSARLEESHEG
ncbi:MAG TPA: lysoplasmalogenase [Thermoanaerobaculia bacterium]|nr:lysoplasmalogenase [Thermoanaerobaculia bacterium]HUM30368.1 lysoplasmalogenase [Thermoanaerobaculia bacterium]HXK68621.1 lysoplasmalogenase [Thermoanaerobaculia bacterium]